ncbi:hypothetical protein BDZ91DRAFT_822891 [Kalaharituber pfeilii]|nr:hypothetical protein BDZ91DRAFT_822891 [Kalaharituber pfeilii]
MENKEEDFPDVYTEAAKTMKNSASRTWTLNLETTTAFNFLRPLLPTPTRSSSLTRPISGPHRSQDRQIGLISLAFASAGAPMGSRKRSRTVALAVILSVGVLAFLVAEWVPWNLGSSGGRRRFGWGYGEGEGKVEGVTGVAGETDRDRGDFDWDSITPSTTLTYYRCFPGFECARLSVPLDYSNPANPSQAHIALIKLPSRVPESSPYYRGPLLLNPGGPGASGVSFALQTAETIQSIVGTNFSIVGFDPRGVNNTVPLVSCFRDSGERKLWAAKGGSRVLGSYFSSPGLVDSDKGGDGTWDAAREEALETELGEAFVRARMFAKQCLENVGDAARYLGTADVARDLRIINRAHWEEKGRVKGLQYWGFSYGTILGMAYAAMFPDEVERMVLDGVIDTRDYYGLGWVRNLQTADGVFEGFYEWCADAGPESLDTTEDGAAGCAFWAPSPEGIKSRLVTLLHHLKAEPVPAVLVNPFSSNYTQLELITYSDVRNAIFTSLYAPHVRFPVLARFLKAVEDSDPLTLERFRASFNLKQFILPFSSSSPSSGPGGEDGSALMGKKVWDDLHAREPTPAILCLDSYLVAIAPNLTAHLSHSEGYSDAYPFPYPDQSLYAPADYVPYVKTLIRQSSVSGSVWAQIRLACTGWTPEAGTEAASEEGTSGVSYVPEILLSPKPPLPPQRVRTANPVLFIGNTLDPTTPLANMRTMRQWFDRAGGLVVAGRGHCSVNVGDGPGMGVQKCVKGVVGAYFDSGEVMEQEEVLCRGEEGEEDNKVVLRGVEEGGHDVDFGEGLEKVGRAIVVGKAGWR